VSSTALLCCWVFALSVANFVLAAKRGGWDWGAAAGDHPAAIVCAVYTFLGFWFVGGLTALHSYLVTTNQTTYEHFRHRYSGGRGASGRSGSGRQSWRGNVAACACTARGARQPPTPKAASDVQHRAL
jgi:palmitoyltransferase ZDHHC9/14/18